jgi:hypothetical protein
MGKLKWHFVESKPHSEDEIIVDLTEKISFKEKDFFT